MYHLRKTAAVLLAAASVSSAVIAAHADGVTKGDLNGDGAIDSNDALLTLHASLAPELLSSNFFDSADFNEDGNVDSQDALLILRESVNLSEYELPVAPTPVEEPVKEEPVLKETYVSEPTHTQVADMKGWSSAEVVRAVGPLFTEDQRKTGILASVSMAQFIIESGYGQSRLSLEANNCFGIKGWAESTPRVDCPWDGVSVYIISTKEYDQYGNVYYEDASFRKYACMEDSIADHSRILITSTDGDKKRYADVVGCTDYRKAAQIIKDGGYATAPDYVDLICDVIEYWDLTQYDLASQPTSGSFEYPTLSGSSSDDTNAIYSVRTDADDLSAQIGAFSSLETAQECADSNPGYSVYDGDGNCVYSPF